MTAPLIVKVGREGTGVVRRVVVHLAPLTIARVDMLLPQWPRAKRSEVLRALILRGLDAIDAPEVPDEQCIAPVLDELKRAKTCPERAYLKRAVDGAGLHWFCPRHAREIDAKRAVEAKGGA